MTSQIDRAMTDTVTQRMNRIADILHGRIKEVAAQRAEDQKPKGVKGDTAQSAASTEKDIKGIKDKIRVISSDMEYPFPAKDIYSKFLEIEDEFNDKLQTGSYEYFNRFHQLMLDFKEFFLVALGKMNKKDKTTARIREQTIDVLNDVEHYLKEGSFPDVSIAQRAKNLAERKPLTERASNIIKNGDNRTMIAALRQISLNGGTEVEQARAILAKYPFLNVTEANSLLEHFRNSNAGIAIVAPLPPAHAGAGAGAAAPAAPAVVAPVVVPPPAAGPASAMAKRIADYNAFMDFLTAKNYDFGARNINARVARDAYRYLEDHDYTATQAKSYYNTNRIFEKLHQAASAAAAPPAAAAAGVVGTGLVDESKARVYANKGAYDFPKDVQHTVKLLSFYNEFNADDIKGSSSFKSMVNNSDFDCFQQIYENKSYRQAVLDVTKKMQEVVKRLMKQKQLYIMDIKCGLDTELEFDFPALKSGKVASYSQKNVLDFLTEVFKKNYIDEFQYKEGRELALPKLSLEEYFELKDYLRKLKTLRWEPVDFIKGKQNLSAGRVKQLSDAMGDKTLIKIDAIAKVGSNNRLIEFSNIYEFWARDEPINAQELDYVKMIKEEIFMLYTFGKYAKMDKRILLLDRYYKTTERVEILTDLFNSSLGILNKNKGDLEAIVALIEKYPNNLPWATILVGLDSLRERFSNISDFDFKTDDINDALFDLTKLSNTDKNREFMMKELETIMDYCGDILNKQALAFNKKHGLEPLPAQYK